MRFLLIAVDTSLEIYCWILFAFAALHVLNGFKVIDIRDRRIAVVNRCLEKATAYPLWPFRKIIPDLGEIDISPLILIQMLMTIRYALALNAWPEFM